MTFPTVPTVGFSSETADTTTHDVTLPSGISSGDRLVLFASLDGVPTLSGFPAGWSQIVRVQQVAGGDVMEVWEKVNATGSETSFTYTSSASERSVNRCFRVSGSHASQAMEAAAGGANNSATSFNCPTVTPSWGAEDNLIVVMLTYGPTQALTGYPAGYSANQYNDTTGSTSNDAGLAVATNNVNASSENPDSFTVAASTAGCSKTLAIRPAAGAAATVVDPFGMAGFFGA